MSTSQTINGLQHYLPDSTDAEFGAVLSSLMAGMAYKQTALVVFSGASGLAAGAYRYLPPGYGAASADVPYMRAPFAGRLRGMRVRARTAPDANVTLAVVVGSNEDTTATLNSGTTTASYSNSTGVAVAAGDLVYVYAVAAGGYTSGGADLSVSFILEAA